MTLSMQLWKSEGCTGFQSKKLKNEKLWVIDEEET